VNNLRFLWIGLRKDAAGARRDPFALLVALGVPLVLAVLMNMVFGRTGEATPQGQLLIADEDRSMASAMLIGVFSHDPLSKMIHVQQVDRAHGRARIDRGEASAFLIIPQGLQTSIWTREPKRLELYTNPSQRILPQIVQESLSMYIDGVSAMQKGASPFSNPYMNAPLVRLDSQAVSQRHALNFAALFFPSMIFMSLMLMANTLAGEIWRERLAGTLRRLAATPVPLGWYLAGRVIFVGILLFGVAIVGVLAVHWLAGVPVSNLPAAVAWVIFSGSTLYLCLLYLVMGAQTARTANILGNLVIFPLMMIGGCFFPFEAMPDWMAHIGRMTPNGWAVAQFKVILAGAVQPAPLALSTAGLLAVSVVAFVLAARRMRRGFLL
jgi:ABC-type multidrug transport system permease subunit